MLHHLLEEAASAEPGRDALVDPGVGSVTYAELYDLAQRLAGRLREIGVQRGDRVGVCMPKSIDAVAAIFGILRCGAAYVPLDPTAPGARNAFVAGDCRLQALVADEPRLAAMQSGEERPDPFPPCVALATTGGGRGLRAWLSSSSSGAPDPESSAGNPDDLAYILYTSGSTGRPKGVMHSHRNAMAFVDWCAGVFRPTGGDRFSSHAPFHFDLSILDLYLAARAAATLILIDEQNGKNPALLASIMAEQRISVWYSTPTILRLLVEYGRLEDHEFPDLRLVLFAGEVFPIKHLRAVQEHWPGRRYFNLYGPTETNVCTWYEAPCPLPESRIDSLPIGRACPHYRTRVVDAEHRDVEPGDEGELCIAGPGVMLGYWGRPELTRASFLEGDGGSWYRTGDLVVEQDGRFLFHGRRDRMVKRNGYRVELGEIESCLHQHPGLSEVAAVAVTDDANGVRIRAFVGCCSSPRPSLIALKRFCAERLPSYMIPDLFSFVDALPKTSTDKVDYQALQESD